MQKGAAQHFRPAGRRNAAAGIGRFSVEFLCAPFCLDLLCSFVAWYADLLTNGNFWCIVSDGVICSCCPARDVLCAAGNKCAREKQADADKETSPAQKTIDSTQENNMRANDLSAQVVEVNDDNQTSAPEILVTSQTKQHTVRPNGVIKGPAALNNIVQPSLAKSFKNKTTNNILPRTGDESSLPIIALGAVIGLAGIGAALRRYE